ncbi:hypothetical protein RJT34_03302 [Clitoria ternatea]|uniref:Uncharacterized protein n=1 Tax=Clitoria ternatea TaxID=43366 RepID=A0AAN9KK15_CLITE
MPFTVPTEPTYTLTSSSSGTDGKGEAFLRSSSSSDRLPPAWPRPQPPPPASASLTSPSRPAPARAAGPERDLLRNRLQPTSSDQPSPDSV